MDLILVGYVLHVLACAKVDGEVSHDCTVIPTRSAPTNLYTCQSKIATASERLPAFPETAFGLRHRAYHFEMSCEPAKARSDARENRSQHRHGRLICPTPARSTNSPTSTPPWA